MMVVVEMEKVDENTEAKRMPGGNDEYRGEGEEKDGEKHWLAPSHDLGQRPNRELW
jgi:hypothetical protein